MKRFKGLTLIEMVVTISVLGVVAAIAVPSFIAQAEKAKAEKLEMDIRQLVEHAGSYSQRRWKPAYIHMINIPSDSTTGDSSWCLVASPYSSVTECSDAGDTAHEKANEKRIATVFGNKHPSITLKTLKRLISQDKIKFDNHSATLFLGADREFDIDILEIQSGNRKFTAKVDFMGVDFQESPM